MPKSRIPYRPHSKQIDFHNAAGVKNRGLFCSRRWGKDEGTVHEVSRLLQHWQCIRKPSHIIPRIHAWFVSPTFGLSLDWERRFQRIWPGPMVSTKSQHRYDLGRDTILEFRSEGDRPDRLVSVGLDLLVMTECHMISDHAITELRPTLISPERFGNVLATGIPSAVPWMEDWKHRADSGDPRYWYYTGPSSENPYIDRAELQAEIDNTPEYLRGPLYLGKWPAAEGSVFRHIDKACVIEADNEAPIFHDYTGGQVFDGLDLARQNDFMVYVALEQLRDGTLKQVGFDRFNRNDWKVQVNRVAAHTRRYHDRSGTFDATGIGDVVGDLLDDAGADFDPFVIGANKGQLVTCLSNALDSGKLRLFNNTLIRDELRRYTYRTTADNNIKYSAPTGYHDDIVMALALACWSAQHGRALDSSDMADIMRRFS